MCIVRAIVPCHTIAIESNGRSVGFLSLLCAAAVDAFGGIPFSVSVLWQFSLEIALCGSAWSYSSAVSPISLGSVRCHFTLRKGEPR